MPLTTLELESRGPVAWIWMNRGERHNAFDETLIAELTGMLEAVDADAGTRAVVLAGRGKSFSAGADLHWMKLQGAAPMDDNLADAHRLAKLFRVLAECSKPTLARVHGAAMGGGMGLAAACDVCVASTAASFATSEVRLGLIPGVISPYVVRAIGERQAYRYFLTGERISAARGQALGLVHELAEPEQLDAAVQTLLDALLAGGPKAQTASKALIRAVAHRPLGAELIDDCARRIAELRATPEAGEGLSAFLEKRSPVWGV